MARYSNLSAADVPLIGPTSFGSLRATQGGYSGIPFVPLHEFVLTNAPAGVADLIIDDATSTELPNATTITYTTTNDGTSPVDKTGRPSVALVDNRGVATSVWDLGFARTLTATATHATSVVEMTVVLTGYDAYRAKMVESLAITATGTSKTAAGKKAFRYLQSVAITAAADATANTLTVGTGNVFGLPWKLTNIRDVIAVHQGDTDDTYTAVVGDATTPSATTGDVRGTIAFNTTPDGTVDFSVLYIVRQSGKMGAAGLSQYAG